MGYYATFEFKGDRKIQENWSTTVSCPTNKKYITCIGMAHDFTHLSKLYSANYYQGGAFAGDGVKGTGGGTDKHVITGTTTQATMVTPVKIKNTRITYNMRNNFSKVANVTLFEIKPKDMVPTNYTWGTINSAVNPTAVLMDSIFEGIADKFSTAMIQTSKVCRVHTASPGANEVAEFRGIRFTELSLSPELTIFDSSLFGSLFSVVNVHTLRIKPGDTLKYVVDCPGVFFQDGVEPYINNAISAYPFTKMVFIQLLGEVAHDATAAVPGAPPVTDSVANLKAALKQESGIVGHDTAFLDVFASYETDIEVYDATLQEPITAFKIESGSLTTMSGNYTQSIADLN